MILIIACLTPGSDHHQCSVSSKRQELGAVVDDPPRVVKTIIFRWAFWCKVSFHVVGLGVVFPRSNYCLVCPSHCQMMPHCKYSQTTREARWWKKNQFGHFFVHAFLSTPRLQTIFCEYFEYYDTKVTILALSLLATGIASIRRSSLVLSSINFLSFRYHKAWRACNKNESLWLLPGSE